MPFVPISNAAEVVFFIRQDGQELRNVSHFTVTTPPYTGPELEDLLDEIEAWLLLWQPWVSATATLYQLSAKALNSETGVQRIRAVNYPGTKAGEALAANATVAIKKVTGLAGRSNRGRWYHPGLVEADTTLNTIVAGTLSGLKTLYDGLTLLTGGFVHHLAVASKFTNGAPRVVGVATEVIEHVIDPIVDSQRRRLPGRGA